LAVKVRQNVYLPHTFGFTAVLPVHPCSTLWRYMFGRQARDLEQSNTAEDEYMISDSDLWITKYVSVPREMGHFNPAAFVAGVVRGALDGAGFPARWVQQPLFIMGWCCLQSALFSRSTGRYTASCLLDPSKPWLLSCGAG
jgi:hypothetical protein